MGLPSFKMETKSSSDSIMVKTNQSVVNAYAAVRLLVATAHARVSTMLSF